MRKIYGARGLLEWQLSLPAGDATVKVIFSGGSMGTNGIIPAKFTTSNKAIQHLIEKSHHFKSGKIFLYSSDKN